MANQKKIALLNMRYDNNYGGNLQRYAMVTVLQHMGYSVEYLYIRDNWNDWFTNRSKMEIIKKALRQVVRHLLNPKNEPWLAWHIEQPKYRESCLVTEPFLEKYIPHTKPIFTHRELERVFKRGQYDIIVAGSDQIWRKQYVERYGLGTWFLDFVPKNYRGKRIVYGASFGVEESKYTKEEQDLIKPLFNKIDAVSVREESALKLFDNYGWIPPKAIHVLDPTLLLSKEDYMKIIKNAYTEKPKGNLFCYILDYSKEKDLLIHSISTNTGLTPFYISIEGHQPSVEQWLRSFMDSEYVITDSFHGFIFALIFNKPFHLINNEFRGNARFDSIKKTILNGSDIEHINWAEINNRIEKYKESSLLFLENALNSTDNTFAY